MASPFMVQGVIACSISIHALLLLRVINVLHQEKSVGLASVLQQYTSAAYAYITFNRLVYGMLKCKWVHRCVHNDKVLMPDNIILT